MLSKDTDSEWEKWGNNDPYFGVVTHDKYRKKNITDEAKNEFFQSGQREVKKILETCKRHLDENFAPKNVLEFGCGVGRLTIPLAKISNHVVGLDVSTSMLNEAQQNCTEHSITNVSLQKSDDNFSALDGTFDFIYSYIVFQHIPVTRGELIFTNLLKLLESGGICVIQLTYANSYTFIEKETPSNKEKSGLHRMASRLFHIFKKSQKPEPEPQPEVNKDPEMQMNHYNLNKLFYILQSMGIKNIYLDFTDHGGELGQYLYFKKP
ncbi:MAG: class I SAM-dependent methyltransferase [Magnetococcales bacterium]|nr:class I SAM-dependent methyltransferase [Magnetococcales bacterium]